jgi:octaprenyl-diphosphate synthase
MIKAEKRTNEEFQEIQDLIIKYNIKQQIIACLNILEEDANKLLAQITQQNIYKNHLSSLIKFISSRSY